LATEPCQRSREIAGPDLADFTSTLRRDTSDLGRLISEEARSIRRDVQRELVETAERRGQQVWVPVTVAALLPGVLFLAIPFMAALDLFSGS